MAERQIKVAVIAGELVDARSLTLLEPLRSRFDLLVHVLDGPALARLGRSPIKMMIYEIVPDMPGYMRGLEEALAGVDAIIAIETSRLASFQAVRAARKHGIPLGVIAHEHHPYFYERYANIRAIQYDICNKADAFWASSDLAAASLRLDHVPESAIRRIEPLIDIHRFTPDPRRRAKFRQYVGIDADECVVLFPHTLEANHRPELALSALNFLRRGLSGSTRLRLVFAGDGPSSLELKYKAVDYGLGQQVLFLHQDHEPFRQDLFAASDLVLMPRPLKSDHHEEAPWLLLEAMAAGAVPVVGVGSLAAEWVGDGGFIYSEDTGESMAAAIRRVLDDPVGFERARQRGLAKIAARHRNDLVPEAWIVDIRALAATRSTAAIQPQHVLAQAEREISAGAESSALMRIEEALLAKGSLAPAEYADLMALKGEAHYSLGEFELAISAFSAALERVDRHARALCGLGFIAWQSHSHEEALSFFKKALAKNEHDANAMYGLGLVYRRVGLMEEAMFWLEKSLGAPNPPPMAFVAMAQTALASSDGALAIHVLERVVENAGEHKALLMALGQLYVSSGKTEKGNAILAMAMADEPRRA